MPPTHSLGLSRAYAVLGYLEKLRETDIADPVLTPLQHDSAHESSRAELNRQRSSPLSSPPSRRREENPWSASGEPERRQHMVVTHAVKVHRQPPSVAGSGGGHETNSRAGSPAEAVRGGAAAAPSSPSFAPSSSSSASDAERRRGPPKETVVDEPSLTLSAHGSPADSVPYPYYHRRHHRRRRHHGEPSAAPDPSVAAPRRVRPPPVQMPSAVSPRTHPSPQRFATAVESPRRSPVDQPRADVESSDSADSSIFFDDDAAKEAAVYAASSVAGSPRMSLPYREEEHSVEVAAARATPSHRHSSVPLLSPPEGSAAASSASSASSRAQVRPLRTAAPVLEPFIDSDAEDEQKAMRRGGRGAHGTIRVLKSTVAAQPYSSDGEDAPADSLTAPQRRGPRLQHRRSPSVKSPTPPEADAARGAEPPSSSAPGPALHAAPPTGAGAVGATRSENGRDCDSASSSTAHERSPSPVATAPSPMTRTQTEPSDAAPPALRSLLASEPAAAQMDGADAAAQAPSPSLLRLRGGLEIGGRPGTSVPPSTHPAQQMEKDPPEEAATLDARLSPEPRIGSSNAHGSTKRTATRARPRVMEASVSASSPPPAAADLPLSPPPKAQQSTPTPYVRLHSLDEPRRGGGRRSSPPPPPVAPTLHVSLLALVEELSAAGSATLLRELEAMKTTCADANDPDSFTDSLTLTVLLNKRSCLRNVVVPLLAESLLRSLSHEDATGAVLELASQGEQQDQADDADPSVPRWSRSAVAAAAAARTPETRRTRGILPASAALCALIGLGDAAAETLPLLCEMLQRGEGDPRLVAMAVRAVAGADGLHALAQLVRDPESAVTPHTSSLALSTADKERVRCAALYGLSVMPYTVLGHTTVLCVPGAGGGASAGASPLGFYAEPITEREGGYVEVELTATAAARATRGRARAEEKWRPRDGTTATVPPPPPPVSVPATATFAEQQQGSLQPHPPYQPTHIVLHAGTALRELAPFIASASFRPQREYPALGLVLRDFFLFFSEELLQRGAHADAGRTYWRASLTPTVQAAWTESATQLREFLSVVEDTIENAESVTMPLLTIPYAHATYVAQRPDTVFKVEERLLAAVLDGSSAAACSAAVQEQALLSLASLPPAARPHVGQPIMDFALAYSRRFYDRWGTRSEDGEGSLGEGGLTDKALSAFREPGGGGAAMVETRERDEERVLVAAALAVGHVTVPQLHDGFAGRALEQTARGFLLRLLASSSRQVVRHAACVGLGALGTGGVCTAAPAEGGRGGSRAVSAPHGSLLAPFAAVTSALTAAMANGRVAAATATWAMSRQSSPGVRGLLKLLAEPTLPPHAHVCVARALGQANILQAAAESASAGEVGARSSSPAAAKGDLLDAVVVGLTHAVITPGVLAEEAVLTCVFALAAVVDRCDPNASAPPPEGVDVALDEAATYYKQQEPCDCFLVLRSVIESAMFPFEVLKSLFLCLCRGGGSYGELYASQTVVESEEVSARAAAAFGLRACGAKTARTLAMAMCDDAAEVRREGFSTLEAVGVESVVEVLRSPRRPPYHREQVTAALRDCLLRDLGRGVRRTTAERLYELLLAESGSSGLAA